MYNYRARLVRVIDGDTVELEIDLGFRVSIRDKVRLYGINAPERRGTTMEAGDAATQYLSHLLQTHAPDGILTIHTYRDAREKYGRWLGTLLASGRDINRMMVHAGHATIADY